MDERKKAKGKKVQFQVSLFFKLIERGGEMILKHDSLRFCTVLEMLLWVQESEKKRSVIQGQWLYKVEKHCYTTDVKKKEGEKNKRKKNEQTLTHYASVPQLHSWWHFALCLLTSSNVIIISKRWSGVMDVQSSDLHDQSWKTLYYAIYIYNHHSHTCAHKHVYWCWPMAC